MQIADLHIHSKYSRATSRDCDAPHLDLWARRKGISIVGTGDFTHPAWREELKTALSPAEDGFYTLNHDIRLSDFQKDTAPRFVISGEISSIYKKDGRVRKVHNLILLPGLEEAEILSKRLEAIGNLHSDGRPILGLDSRDLLEITLDVCPRAVFIPAHIWTPHFSLFGAFSGFDTLEDCFGDLSGEIHALETGLSSDPDMNARVSALDRYTLVSNSDAHSPGKLGREANLLDIDWSYDALADALQGRNSAGFCGTVEFFPEEGKYHLDGHRNCGVCLTPAETIRYGGRCALETGLSSDPDMNARVSALDRYTLVSNSDAHSPGKLGREANLLDIDWSYDALADALQGRNSAGFCGTVEFFPEEGKYHLDGHRNCGVCLTPAETIRYGGRCPVCGGKITIGVEHRIEELADRPMGAKRETPFESLAPLPEVIAASTGMSAAGKRVQEQYARMLRELGPEFYILREAPLADVGQIAGAWVQEGLRRLRAGEVVRKPGFDGQYGVIELLSQAEIGAMSGQVSLFGTPEPPRAQSMHEDAEQLTLEPAEKVQKTCISDTENRLNAEQRAAVCTTARVTAVTAGPGTGKTQTLTERIAYMIGTLGIPASQIVAVTFTRQAAEGLRQRLAQTLGGMRAIRGLTVGTFHAIAWEKRQARGQKGTLLAPDEALALAEQSVREIGWDGTPAKFLQAVSALKNGVEEERAGLLHEHAADRIYDWNARHPCVTDCGSDLHPSGSGGAAAAACTDAGRDACNSRSYCGNVPRDCMGKTAGTRAKRHASCTG